MSISIFEVCPNPIDATSFYRGRGPLAHLNKKHDQLNIIPFSRSVRVFWDTLKLVDVLFLQRPHHQEYLTLAQMAKNLNIPVWVDFDDNFFVIEKDNPNYDQFHRDETLKPTAQIIALADVVTVSTHKIKQSFQKLNKNIHVIKNAIDDSFQTVNKWKKTDPKRGKCFFWRGSKTHHADVLHYGTEMMDHMVNYREYIWIFLGQSPWFFDDYLRGKIEKEPYYLYAPSMDIIEYFKYLKDLGPEFFVVPLKKTLFNLCKSDITYLEAIMFNSLPLVPDWEEWKNPGAVHYSDHKSFAEGLKAMVYHKFDHEKMHNQARDYILSERVLSKTNEKRWEIIQELVEKRN